MTEQAEIAAKIAALHRKINQQRNTRPQPYPTTPPYSSDHAYAARGAGRWAARGRGGRAGYHQPASTRVWVAGGGTSTPPPAEPVAVPAADTPETPPAGKKSQNASFIPRNSVGKKELMNRETFEREQRQKQEYQRARALQLQQQTRAQPGNSSMGSAAEDPTRQMTIEGITFQVSKDGSKLVRVPDVYNALQETPKRTTVAGVQFHRTKNGNLLRAPPQRDNTRSTKLPPRPQCETFTKQGSCPYGPKCRFTHDPEKVAICKGFLLRGTCSAGDYCDLSHEMSYRRVSACTHFLRGNCTNDACRYPHVNVSPSAPVCRAFATLGYCASGEKCRRRHVVECPDHANHGNCTDMKCQLPHVDRASVMRKAAQRQAKIVTGSDGDSDLSSDDDDGGDDDAAAPDHELEVDDVDDGDEDAVMTGLGNRHEPAQQQDYIPFS